MSIQSRVISLERARAAIERERLMRNERYKKGARFLTDAELETVIFQQTGIPPEQLTDDVLRRIAGGGV